MDITLDYQFTLKLFEKLGGDKFIELFNKVYGFELYCMSRDWIQNKKYILKFKGERGDLIVSWN